MKPRRKSLVLLVLAVLCIAIKWYSFNDSRVESSYSNGFFPKYAEGLRFLFGKISFSIGDIFYGLSILWIIYNMVSIFVKLLRKKNIFKKENFKRSAYTTLVAGAIIYIVFNIAWGINYNRKGISKQLGLTAQKYTAEDLKQMNCLLIQKVNDAKASMIMHEHQYPTTKEIINLVAKSYEKLAKTYPYLGYHPVSLKKSIWSGVGNYAGFSGYYNPFTGEAQFSNTIPKFLQPFTACHEVAHQLGYAKEQEANFVGYMAAANSNDSFFHYSVYLELFMYTNRNLAAVDSLSARVYRKELTGPVKDDIAEWVKFNREHIGLLEPVVKWIYGAFLQSNEQPQGMLSYDQVTGFLIAYYKKFGRI